MSFSLRPYQTTGVERIRASIRGGARAPLFVLPTGGGKTAVFSYIAMGARERGKRVAILVHRKELLTQASSSLARLGVDHGLISPDFTQANHPVQVASVQTLVRRLDALKDPDIIIVDEAHHATASTYRDILRAFPRAIVLGVTATPIRSDGKGLGLEHGGIFDDLILGPTIGELIAGGYLVDPLLFAPPLPANLEGIRIERGDYSRREQAFRLNRPSVTGCAIEHYKRICPGVPAIAFCADIKHAESVAQEFSEAGIRARSVDGNMPDLERRLAIDGLATGKIDMLTSASLIGEGVDVPACGAVIQLRRTISKALWLQQIGRALRPALGKKNAFVLDHVGNAVLHQAHPTDDHEWSLEGSEMDGEFSGECKESAAVKLVQCKSTDPECHFVFEKGPVSCPKCGHELPRNGGRRPDLVDGELEGLTKEKLKELRDIARDRARAREEATA